MMDLFWLSLVAKMAASASIVVAASFVVERLGPFLGAMVATLPISAGPAYVFLAMEHGPQFIEKSSLVSFSANAATVAFIATYAFLAQSRSVLISLLGALIVWFLAAWIITQSQWTLSAAAALNIATFAICFIAVRRHVVNQISKGGTLVRKKWDVPVRALGVMIVVGAVVLIGRLVGPTWAGIAASVPIVLTSLAIILHPRLGGPTTASVVANGLPGIAGMALALAILHATVSALGSAWALTLALTICLLWNAGLVLLRRWIA